MNTQGLILEGRFVRLEPLTQAHTGPFLEAGAEWGSTPDFVSSGIVTALQQRDEGSAIPFATIDRASGRVAGGTRFLQIDATNRRLEIGSTWLGQTWRRTALNTEAKLLMLTHAFEVMGCIRVEFRADAENERSRIALRRIGAHEEGTLRNDRIDAKGRPRHTVVYSIIDSDGRRSRPVSRGCSNDLDDLGRSNSRTRVGEDPRSHAPAWVQLSRPLRRPECRRGTGLRPRTLPRRSVGARNSRGIRYLLPLALGPVATFSFVEPVY